MFGYYRYLDTFHTEPKSWNDLFEFFDFAKTQSKLNEYFRSLGDMNNG